MKKYLKLVWKKLLRGSVMKYKLSQLIKQVDERNTNGEYNLSDVRGISIQKVFIDTKAKMDGVSLNPYKQVKPDTFAYVTVTSRNSEKITLAYNNTEDTYIVSSSYVVFKNKEPKLLSSEFLFMYFNRPEFDRYSRYNSWGSARETFSWDDMCDIEIDLPPLEIQEKYVAIYKAMLANQKAYENGLEDLKLVCDATIERLRREMPSESIGKYIEQVREMNSNLEITLEQGVNISKRFITPQRSNADLSKRLIVRKGQFVYSAQLNNENVAIAYREEEDCVVSPVYTVFFNKHKDILLDKYLMLWLSRAEWGRFVYWQSTGSSYEFLQWDSVVNTKIPIPDIQIQQSIVDIYNAYITRKKINEHLKQQIKDICPILIAGAIKEANANA